MIAFGRSGIVSSDALFRYGHAMTNSDAMRERALPAVYAPEDGERGGIHERVGQHVRRFFGSPIRELVWLYGPKGKVPRRFRVLEVAPGPKTALWCYVSVGAFEAGTASEKTEFVMLSKTQSPRNVELVTMIASYHSEHHLGVGHSLPMGEPWAPGSACDQFLISLPYPFGPDLEVCDVGDGHVHILWLLPITTAEKDFKMQRGLEALEELFDRHGLCYWDVHRPSLV